MDSILNIIFFDRIYGINEIFFSPAARCFRLKDRWKMEDRSAMMRDDSTYCPPSPERHHFPLSLELSALSYILFILLILSEILLVWNGFYFKKD